MNYIDELIANGTNFRVDRKEGSASFSPLSRSGADVEAFQSVVQSS